MHEVRVVDHSTERSQKYQVHEALLHLVVPAMLQQLQLKARDDTKRSLIITVNPQQRIH